MTRVSDRQHGLSLGSASTSARQRMDQRRRKTSVADTWEKSNEHRRDMKKGARKGYKVVMEEITQEKKDSGYKMSWDKKNPPAGYAFVNLEYSDLIRLCKEQCKRENLTVYVVSGRKHKHKFSSNGEQLEHISDHANREGYHFPITVIHANAQTAEFYRSARSTGAGDLFFAQGLDEFDRRNPRSGQPATDDAIRVQGVIRELFPQIPEEDLAAILTHAFEKGTGRVGTATDLSLARRVQLAVLAHIRHTHTPYDSLLRRADWRTARKKAAPIAVAKLKEWTGEVEPETEEIFRQIIVIDDSDDDSDGDTESDSTLTDYNSDESGASVEIVSTRTTGQTQEPARYRHGVGHARESTGVAPFPVRSQAAYHAGSSYTYPIPQDHDRRSRPAPLAIGTNPDRYLPRRQADLPVISPSEWGQPSRIGRGSDGQIYNLVPVPEYDRTVPDARIPVRLSGLSGSGQPPYGDLRTIPTHYDDRRFEASPRYAGPGYMPRGYVTEGTVTPSYATRSHVPEGQVFRSHRPIGSISSGYAPARPQAPYVESGGSRQGTVIPSIEGESNGMPSPGLISPTQGPPRPWMQHQQTQPGNGDYNSYAGQAIQPYAEPSRLPARPAIEYIDLVPSPPHPVPARRGVAHGEAPYGYGA